MSVIRARVVLLVALSVLLSGVISYFSIDAPQEKVSKLIGSEAEVKLHVTEEIYSSSYYGKYVCLVGCDEPLINQSILVTTSDGSITEGDVLTGKLTLSAPSEDEKRTLYLKNVFLTAEAESLTYEKHEALRGGKAFFARINAKASDMLRSDEGSGALAAAVLLGDKDNISTSVQRDFSRVGISHLLALSGLHLSVIVSIVDAFTHRLTSRRSIRLPVRVLSIIAFMALTGFSSSVMRAGIMHVIAAVAAALDRDNDSFTSLSVAAALIVIINPLSVFDAGLLLSVLASYACITYAKLSREARVRERSSFVSKLLHGICDTVKLTLLINAVTLPVMWFISCEVSLISPVSNVIFIPLVTFLLWLSVFKILLFPLPFASVLLTEIIHHTESAITRFAEMLSRIPNVTVSLRHTGALLFSLVLFLCIIPLPFAKGKTGRRLWCACAVTSLCLVLSVALGTALSSISLEVNFIANGKNEGFVLKDGNSFTAVDVSDGSTGHLYALFDAAKEKGATEIDSLVLTHLHRRHISSVPTVADRTLLRQILLPTPENDSDTEVFEKLLSLCGERGIKVMTYERTAGETFTKGSLELKFYEYTMLKRSSHPVVAFAFSLGGKSFAYFGGSALEEGALSLAEERDTVFLGAHPPKTKDLSSFERLRTDDRLVVNEAGLTHALKEVLAKLGEKLTCVADGKSYGTGTYKKE